MDNILLDLGSHKFEGLNLLLKKGIINNTFRVYCYEGNPNVFNEVKNKLSSFLFSHIELKNEVVSDFDGMINFNIDESGMSQGCNALLSPPNEDVLWKTKYKWNKITVPCVSIDSVLEECDIKPEDSVFVKCDIEGSEFEVLSMLLKSPYIFNVKRLFVEWHDRLWFPNNDLKIQQKQDLIYMFNMLNIEVEEWE
jgi:FkbM family methyltransferase